MAVINVDFKKLEKMSGHTEKEVIGCLTNIGMPVEEGEDGTLIVEVTPNRPDLFCIEGVVRAVRSYYDKEIKEYLAAPSEYVIGVSKKTGGVRPAICAAVVKGLLIDDEFLQDIMQMQEKLHDTIGRRRKKVAVGIHDLDKISGKMEYLVASKEKFIPLELEEELDVIGVLKKHPKGMAFAHLVEKDAVIITDEKGVISFPPIINSERTKVNAGTKNVLIESTGTSLETVEKAVNIIACALADRGGKIFQVKVGGKTYPDFTYAEMEIKLDEANRVLGLRLSQKEAGEALLKMGIKSDGKTALVPPYRADVISFTDVLEDIAIGYGYENLVPSPPALATVGKGLDYKDLLHDIFTGLGFIETKNYVLINMEKLKATGRETGALRILNSASLEFTYLRTSLIPGLLRCFATNKMKGLPQHIYEIGRVYNDGEEELVCFGLMQEGASITTLQSYLQSLAKELGKTLELKEFEDPCFIKGRCAKILIGGKESGVIGSVHPSVLEKYGLEHAVAICEIKENALI